MFLLFKMEMERDGVYGAVVVRKQFNLTNTLGWQQRDKCFKGKAQHKR